MAPTSRDRLSVDLHGLKAELFDRAQALGVSPFGFVRSTLTEALGAAAKGEQRSTCLRQPAARGPRVRLCLRMSRPHASVTMEAARKAGLSPGDYVGGLAANVPAQTSGANRIDIVTALVASCAELSTLSRNTNRLAALLRQGDLATAKPYRTMLDILASDVHRHLELAAGVLADWQPQRRAADGAARAPR